MNNSMVPSGDVPYSYAVISNEWSYPDSLAALEMHWLEEHDPEQPRAQREARRLLRKFVRFLLGA